MYYHNKFHTLLLSISLVNKFFKDPEKTYLWFLSPNPQLGNISPIDIIKNGQSDKLLQFIQTSLSENER